jgi:hypothetical protein
VTHRKDVLAMSKLFVQFIQDFVMRGLEIGATARVVEVGEALDDIVTAFFRLDENVRQVGDVVP